MLQNLNHFIHFQAQYKQYEAKWTAWREKLIERREQMRKKREQQKQTVTATAKTEIEKNKNVTGDNKIMDILSSTENQGLINNLLGIGKTLGLTGKQNVSSPIPPLPPPPPPPKDTSSNQHLVTQEVQQQTSQMNMIKPTVAPSWSNQQQWLPQQYNPRVNVPRYGPELPGTDTISTTQANISLSQISPDFTQPPPTLPNTAAQNCPQLSSNFSNNDRSKLQIERVNERDGPAYEDRKSVV